MSSSSIRLLNTLCSFGNTGVKGAWPPENRGIEIFSKARSISLHHNIRAQYIMLKLHVFQQ